MVAVPAFLVLAPAGPATARTAAAASVPEVAATRPSLARREFLPLVRHPGPAAPAPRLTQAVKLTYQVLSVLLASAGGNN